LRSRPEKGLLGGMMEVPSTLWRELPWTERGEAVGAAAATNGNLLSGVVRHTFTHFHLGLRARWRRCARRERRDFG